MSDGLNDITLLGNLGAAPELRYTQAGQAVLNMRLAVSESYLDKDKVERERTEWFSVVVWGKRGEGLAKILDKGDRILIKGSLRNSEYEKEGQKHHKTEVHARDVFLCGGAKRDGADTAPRGDAPPRAQASPGGRGGYSGSGGGAPATGGVAYPGVRSAGDFEVRFGNDKGKPISLATDLPWLRSALVKSINDPSKAQYVEANKGQVNAIDEEMARRKGGGGGVAAPVDDGYGGGSGDDDIPFASCDPRHDLAWMDRARFV